MRKLIGLLAISTSLAVVGCGGESDSSVGGSSVKDQINKYNTCDIVDDMVVIPVAGGCKLSNRRLNYGKPFSLECMNPSEDSTTNEIFYDIQVFAQDTLGVETVLDDIKLNRDDGRLAKLKRVYEYGCLE